MSNHAFFDVDQTIYDGNSTSDFYLYLVSQGLGGEWTIAKDKEIGELYSSGQITYKAAGESAIQLLADTIKGYDVGQIQNFANKFLLTKNKIKPFVVELISILKNSDYETILVSGSPTPNVEAIGSAAGTDRALCTTLEILNNKYTGKVIHMMDDIEKKKVIISKCRLDSTDSIKIGFGDSTGDVAMLSLCNHAFVINPHQEEMVALAIAKGWHLVTSDNILEVVKKTLNIPLNR
ncbi:HAD-IB family hydrolase [Candidatus Woesebacteria bacterium]|nr:HAD-IB family hydrolase [Candidatus Woesebacteria bacterium]